VLRWRFTLRNQSRVHRCWIRRAMRALRTVPVATVLRFVVRDPARLQRRDVSVRTLRAERAALLRRQCSMPVRQRLQWRPLYAVRRRGRAMLRRGLQRRPRMRRHQLSALRESRPAVLPGRMVWRPELLHGSDVRGLRRRRAVLLPGGRLQSGNDLRQQWRLSRVRISRAAVLRGRFVSRRLRSLLHELQRRRKRRFVRGAVRPYLVLFPVRPPERSSPDRRSRARTTPR
jgi:hypothetical protein